MDASHDSPRFFKYTRRIVLLLVFGVSAFMVINWLQRTMLYPSHLVPVPHVAPSHDGEVLHREVSKGQKVEAWFLPARTGIGERPLVVFAHGNGELIDHWLKPLSFYRDHGYHVLLVEYRSYGRSGGTPSQSDIVEDTVHFIDHVRERPDVSPNVLVLHGRSLGGGVVCAVAQKRKPKAVVLMSTFRSVRVMARRFMLPGMLVRDPYDNEAFLKSYKGPVLIVHGTADSLIPFEHAQALSRAAPQAILVRDEGADHNDSPRDWKGFERQLLTFLEGI